MTINEGTDAVEDLNRVGAIVMVKVFFFIFNGLAQQCRENNHSGTKLWAVIYSKNVANICLEIWYRMFDKMFNVCYTSLHHSVIAGVHFFGEMKDLITYFTILSSSIFYFLILMKYVMYILILSSHLMNSRFFFLFTYQLAITDHCVCHYVASNKVPK